MWSSIAAIVLGVVGWLGTSLFGQPLVNFWTLRARVHEEIIYVANITGADQDGDRYHKSVEMLRRLAAQVSATDVSAFGPLKWFLKWRGYNSERAASGLIGLSNELGAKGEKAIHKDSVEVGLRLPRDYSDSDIAKIKPKLSGTA
jgi:hypothetical protein